MKRLALIASSNLDKSRELQEIASEFGIKLLLPTDVGVDPPYVEESGEDYLANALIKARAYHRWSKMPVIADDSGLEVEILNNRPGIHSARYGGGVTQEQKNQLLIQEVIEYERRLGIKNRRANFCCTLVMYFSESQYYHQTTKLFGSVLDSPLGKGGFGYDPIILIDSIGKTLAEIEFNTTLELGFRAEAARKLFNRLDSSIWPVS